MRKATVQHFGHSKNVLIGSFCWIGSCVIFFLVAVSLMTPTVSVAQPVQEVYRRSCADVTYWTVDDARYSDGTCDLTGAVISMGATNVAGSYGEAWAEAVAPYYSVHQGVVKAEALTKVACASAQAWTIEANVLRFERYSSMYGSDGYVTLCYEIRGSVEKVSDKGFVSVTFDSMLGGESLVELDDDYTFDGYVSKQVCGSAHYTIGEYIAYSEAFFVGAYAAPGCAPGVEIKGRAEGNFGNMAKMISLTLSPGHYLAYTASGATYPPALVTSVILNLVTKYYNDVLDRQPEPGGAEWWTAEIERIVSLGVDVKEGFQGLAKFFFNSPEYQLKGKSDVDFVTDLYQTFLNRAPDPGGLNFWLDYLSQGLTRNMLITQFAYSEEFKLYMESLFGSGTTRPENNLVNDLYRGLLNRFPDTDGFNGWLSMMRNAQCTGPQAVRDLTYQIALGFVRSQEYALRNRSNQEYVEDLYNGILRRGADPAGFADWVTHLNSGIYTREEMLPLFTNSQEFQFRVTDVIDAGCMP